MSEHNLGLLPAPAAPEWEPLEPGRARPVAAGTTPTNAPVVTDGSHRLVLRPGRTAVLAVPLGWDQSLQAQLDARLPAGAPDPGGINVEVVTPLLGTSAVPLAEGSADRPADWRTPGVRGGRLRTGAQSQVVAYAHRDSYDSTLTSASLAGVHHVLVRWAAGDAAGAQLRGVRVAATLTLRTTGEPGGGVPAYTPSTLPAPEAGSRLVDGTLPEPAPQGPDARPPAAADDDSVVPLGGRGLAVAALATGLAVVGLLWLRRRRG
ncbi:hypothetical protein [Nocardioides sp. J54]|uniref:hypothetical protein n=1 Tax=Nocardioides sp. J54 TaxID=935866 RepID=UPI0012FC4ABE|nr:hypothetical protein [Nocardioides sp. J54]